MDRVEWALYNNTIIKNNNLKVKMNQNATNTGLLTFPCGTIY